MASSPNRPVERVPLSRIRRQPTHRTTRWRTPRGSAAPRTWIGTSRLSASGYRPHVRRLYRVFFRHSSLRDRSHVAVWRTPVRRILPPRILCPTFRQISRRPKCLVVFSCVPPVVRVSSDIHRHGAGGYRKTIEPLNNGPTLHPAAPAAAVQRGVPMIVYGQRMRHISRYRFVCRVIVLTESPAISVI